MRYQSTTGDKCIYSRRGLETQRDREQEYVSKKISTYRREERHKKRGRAPQKYEKLILRENTESIIWYKQKISSWTLKCVAFYRITESVTRRMK